MKKMKVLVLVLLLMAMSVLNVSAKQSDVKRYEGKDGTWVETNGEIIFDYTFTTEDFKEIDKLLQKNPNISLGEVMQKVCPQTLEKSRIKEQYFETPFNENNTLQEQEEISPRLLEWIFGDWFYVDGISSHIQISGNTITYCSESDAKNTADALWLRSSLKKHTAYEYVGTTIHTRVTEAAYTDYLLIGGQYDLPPTGNYFTEGLHRVFEFGEYSPAYTSHSNIVSFYNPYE